MNATKKILLTIAMILALLNIYWQYDYEQAIKEVKRKCTNVSKRKRIKYTPVFIHKLRYAFDRQELERDRLLHKLLIMDCSNVEIAGYQLMYLTHVYLTEREKDSLLKVYDAEIKRAQP